MLSNIRRDLIPEEGPEHERPAMNGTTASRGHNPALISASIFASALFLLFPPHAYGNTLDATETSATPVPILLAF